MKKKIGEIYNKPIVIGNPNEFNKNEVALRELSQQKEYLYFKFKDNTIFEDLSYLGIIVGCASSFVIKDNNYNETYIHVNAPESNPTMYIQRYTILGFCIDPYLKYNDGTVLELINEELKKVFNIEDINKIEEIIPITEDEYLSLLNN